MSGPDRGVDGEKHAAPSAHVISITPQMDNTDELRVPIAFNTSASQELVCEERVAS